MAVSTPISTLARTSHRRELIEQGYAVIAPDYRGSTGYGRDYWRLIDYGGLEKRRRACRQKVDDREPRRTLIPNAVGILGWSHGGMITPYEHSS